MLSELQDLVTGAADSPWVYPALFAVCVIDAFFPPVPSESVIAALAAIASSTGAPSAWLLIVTAALGAILGDNIAYGIGHGIGTERFGWMHRPKIRDAFDWARKTLDERAALLIITARYIPVGRIAVNMTAGATGYPWRKFFPLSVIGGVSWAVYSVAIASLFGHWLSDRPLLAAVVGIACALVIGFIVDRVVRRFFGRAQDNGSGADDADDHDDDSDHDNSDQHESNADESRADESNADGDHRDQSDDERPTASADDTEAPDRSSG